MDKGAASDYLAVRKDYLYIDLYFNFHSDLYELSFSHDKPLH